jgi:hypothetical protein
LYNNNNKREREGEGEVLWSWHRTPRHPLSLLAAVVERNGDVLDVSASERNSGFVAETMVVVVPVRLEILQFHPCPYLVFLLQGRTPLMERLG